MSVWPTRFPAHSAERVVPASLLPGQADEAAVSLLVEIHNDGTGDRRTGDYDVFVYVTETPTQLKKLRQARVVGFERAQGWLPLVKAAVEAL